MFSETLVLKCMEHSAAPMPVTCALQHIAPAHLLFIVEPLLQAVMSDDGDVT
jgi:hypothetical protein